MRILHVITSLHIGGAERLMLDLLPLLRDSGKNEVELLLFDGQRTLLTEELKTKGITIHSISNCGNVYNPRIVFKLLRFLDGYDIIHTHNTPCQFFVPLSVSIKRVKSKLVTTEHSSNNRRRAKRYFKPLDKWMYSRYNAIICIADKARKNLEQYIGPLTNIYTITNGVDTKRFINPVKDVSSNQAFVVTMVAGLRKEKDHDTLIKAMSHLACNYRLQIVGVGERENELKALCHELELDNRVVFLGARMDIPQILEDIDVIVLSSHWEGLSLSSIEGVASGRPFIASDVDGLHEMVSGAGILFPHGDDVELAQQIQHLCEHPDIYSKVALKCQERAKQFDISVMAKNYLNLYERLMSESE